MRLQFNGDDLPDLGAEVTWRHVRKAVSRLKLRCESLDGGNYVAVWGSPEARKALADTVRYVKTHIALLF